MKFEPHFTLRDVLLEAAIGARGWFLVTAAAGNAMLVFVIASAAVTDAAIGYAALFPFGIAAIMGTYSICQYRHRSHIFITSRNGIKIYVYAVVWNMIPISIALVLEAILTRTGLLSRDIRQPLELLVLLLAMSIAMSLATWFPKGR